MAGTPFTQADVDNANAAIRSVMQGTRRVSVTWSDSGGTRTVQYDKSSIKDLIALRDLMVAEVQSTSGSPKRTRSMFSTTVKGL